MIETSGRRRRPLRPQDFDAEVARDGVAADSIDVEKTNVADPSPRSATQHDAGSSPRPSSSVRSPQVDGRLPAPSAPSGTVTPSSPTPRDRSSKRGEDATEERPGVPLIDTTCMQMVFVIAVILNSCYIGVDTHLRARREDAFASILGIVCDSTFFVIFFSEVMLRVWTDRCPGFFKSGWNCLDLFLVCANALELVLFFSVVSSVAQQSGNLRAVRLIKIGKFFRLIRILRVFRFKRLMRMMRGFFLLIGAIGKVIQAMGWVMLIFALATYVVSIVTTEFIGLSSNDDPEIGDWFGDLFQSMFTLVQISTLSGWSSISRRVSDKHGGIWNLFFMFWVLLTNSVLMNIVLAALMESVFTATSDMKAAQAGLSVDDAASWMKTPSSLASSDEDEDNNSRNKDVSSSLSYALAQPTSKASMQEQRHPHNDQQQPQQHQHHQHEHQHHQQPKSHLHPHQMPVAKRMAGQTLSEVFDLAAVMVGVEGINLRKLVSLKSLEDALLRPEVCSKITQACPALFDKSAQTVAQLIWDACPRRLDKDGLNRQELSDACMGLSSELSMHHFVAISQSLSRLQGHFERDLRHLTHHQQKLNGKFTKLRYRMRKVYHFDGAPRKVLAMMKNVKRQQGGTRGVSGSGEAGRGEESADLSFSDDSDG